MPFALLPILKFAGGGLWSFLSSRFGQIVLAAVLAWFWSGHRADERWRGVIAAKEAAAAAAYQAEVARQEQAAMEIAKAATERAEDDAALERVLRAQIDDFNFQENKHVAPPRTVKQIIFRERIKTIAPRSCVIDNDFAGVVRRLDAAARFPSRSPRRSR